MQTVYLERAIRAAATNCTAYPAAVDGFCAVVASIIASADYGSTEQAKLMAAAEAGGFMVGYFGSIIRVEWGM